MAERKELPKLYDIAFHLEPKFFSVWPGCNANPEDLIKHMISADLIVVTSLFLETRLDLADTNAVEEITYDVHGYPSCRSTDISNRFLRKRVSEIDDSYSI